MKKERTYEWGRRSVEGRGRRKKGERKMKGGRKMGVILCGLFLRRNGSKRWAGKNVINVLLKRDSL